MFRSTFGFLINDSIQVDIHHRRIIKLDMDEARKSYALNVSVIALKDLHMMLLAYLLSNGRQHPVKREDILRTVWDERELKSSSQVLWAAMKTLKSELSLVGLDENFITCDKGARYYINATKVQELYVGS